MFDDQNMPSMLLPLGRSRYSVNCDSGDFVDCQSEPIKAFEKAASPTLIKAIVLDPDIWDCNGNPAFVYVRKGYV